ncbi:CsbD family protein [Paraburkholderia flava]|uniref:CsbD family protein n=1 Tax=Paraburkholderia flava TaxID=2547393 RepID=UPI0030B87DCD
MTAMNEDQRKGLKEELKGVVDKAVGTVTRNDAKKAKGDAEITEGENRKDLGDQTRAAEKGKVDPGNPTNL